MKTETIAQMQRRFLCKALNRTEGNLGKAYNLLVPDGHFLTLRSIYNMYNTFKIEKNSKGIYV